MIYYLCKECGNVHLEETQLKLRCEVCNTPMVLWKVDLTDAKLQQMAAQIKSEQGRRKFKMNLDVEVLLDGKGLQNYTDEELKELYDNFSKQKDEEVL